ncbi:GMC oxidoreductase [Rhodanobacter sp. L36]|uniref:GMC oxidoreductase n=1 Tax=Rhodanobacter sp. L36 TaxID=1747221 RepID=UPI00131E3FD7|nr:GMC oxidoreductase [Rhodanobacter sp. L36]
MIIDYLDGSTPSNIDTDVCIIGAGAAGIAIAHAFVGTSTRICIIESGGLAGERISQKLHEGESVGSPTFDSYHSRMRAFGGSCNLWGGGCVPLNKHDLEQRDWVPDSGWPISYAELAPWYDRVRVFCRIDTHDIVDGAFTTAPSVAPLPLDDATLSNQSFVSAPILFGDAYRNTLEKASNISVLLHANLLELQPREDGASIDHARIGALDGRRGKVSARHFVLACGGIENARLLLLSNSVVPQGLGNQHDLVGRYFMDHPCGNLGKLFTDSPDIVIRPYDQHHGEGRAPLYTKICLSPQVQYARHLLNGRIHAFPVEARLPDGIRALRALRAKRRQPLQDEGAQLSEQMWQAMKHDKASDEPAATTTDSTAKLMLRIGLGVGDIAHAFVRKLRDRTTVVSDYIALTGYFEQAPNPLSRITLGDEHDALGQRRARIDWQLTPIDRRTYREAATLFGDELARSCNGRFEPESWLLDDDAPAKVHGTAHHMGTTRMADDPRHGVVDRHCRVHGIDNLHVAGSSVFPTGGWAFPTLTIVALAQRLADTLQATTSLQR